MELNRPWVLAALPELPASAYLALAKTGDPRLTRVIAANPHIPQSVTVRLAASRDASTRRWAITNLADLSAVDHHHKHAARLGVAGNRRADPSLLGQLALHSDHEVARTALANPATPMKAVLHRLAQPSRIVDIIGRGNEATKAARASRILAAHPDLVNHRQWWEKAPAPVVRSVARQPNINGVTAEYLWAQPGRRGKAALTLNPYAPFDLFTGAWRERRAKALGRYALTPPTSVAELVSLAASCAKSSPTVDWQIAQAIAAHDPAVPMSFAARMAARRQPNVDAHTLSVLADAAPQYVLVNASGLAGTMLEAAAESSPVMVGVRHGYRREAHLDSEPAVADISLLQSQPDDKIFWRVLVRLLATSDVPVREAVESVTTAVS